MSVKDVQDVVAGVPQPVRSVVDVLEGAGHCAVVVGGAVRDLLMGRQPGDFDVATSAVPEQVMALFPDNIPTGLKHGTITVLVGSPSRTPVEVTTFRVEGGYADGRRPDHVSFVQDVREDLSRRDFTVNAMALRFHPTPHLVDPFHGAEDLRDGVLRAVGEADQRFGEDGLRAVRAARFVTQLQLRPAPGLEEAMGRAASIVAKVSPERVLQELVKMFDKARTPSAGLTMLSRSGLMKLLLPLAPSNDVALTRPDRVPASMPQARWAAWLWEAGKQAAQDTLVALRSSRALQDDVGALVTSPRVDQLVNVSDAHLRQVVRGVGGKRVEWLKALWRADGGEALAQRCATVMARGYLDSPAQLCLDGHALSQLTGLSGAALGRLMKALVNRVDEEPELNEPRALTVEARRLAGLSG